MTKEKLSIDLKLRPIERSDFAQLVEWINAPHVARYWDGQTDLDAVEAKYGTRIGADTTTRVYVVELNDRPIGMIQCYRHADYPDWERTVGIEKAAGIDYLIGEAQYVELDQK